MGSITHSDVAQALQSALEAAQSTSTSTENGDGAIDYSYGFSMSEIAKLLDAGMDSARRRMRVAIENGTVECAGKQKRKNIANVWNVVPVYRVKVEVDNEV